MSDESAGGLERGDALAVRGRDAGIDQGGAGVETRGDEPVSDEDLLEPLQGRVAPWWIPDEVFRIPSMPLAPTGKIDKMRLRSEYGNG